MVWLVLGSIAAAGLGALMAGRKWGLAVGRRLAARQLEEQAAELKRQQLELESIRKERDASVRAIEEAETAEEAADAVADLVTGWNSGK